jgi:enoyl-CoA hydratase/carnithine racemase
MQRLSQLQAHLASSPAPLLELSTLDGCIGVLGMNSASNLNALTEEMRGEICAGLLKFERDPKIKVVLLRSNIPKGFCAGANIKEFKPADYHQRMLNDNFKDLSVQLETFRKPLIVSVNRFAFGGGFELCCAADVVVCDEGCNFGFPEINLGIFPGIGGTLISKTIGKYILFFSGNKNV